MKHYFSTRVRVVLIASLLLVVVMAILGSLVKTDIGSNVVQGLLSPLRAGASKLTDGAEQLYSYIFRYEALAAENELLREKIAQMEENDRLADALAQENERLRQLLELKETNQSYKMVDAHVIGSGGVSCLDDLRNLRDAGCAGAILGRAMYEGAFTVEEAIKAMEEAS